MIKFKRTRIFEHKKNNLDYSDLQTETLPTGRTYVTPEGNKYPSITTILSVRSRDSIQEWRARVGEEEANRISRHACTRGNALHNLAERYINNEEIVLTGDEMPHVQLSFAAVQKILDENMGLIHLQESALYSDMFRIAGRVDLIGEFDSELSIIDFKTASRIKSAENISSYFIQASFYAAAYYERTGIPIKQCVIIMAVDGNPKPLIFRENTFKWLPELEKVIAEYNREKLFGR